MPPKNEPSNNFDWMVVKPSLEEELTLERSVREIEDCDNADVLSRLCVAMARQQWHQSKLLKQAVGHIALMEAVFFDATQKP
tara:strand:- start:3241 stop:3486 length:246 start_codon:yes stop_codon:yes gene_type:complete